MTDVTGERDVACPDKLKGRILQACEADGGGLDRGALVVFLAAVELGGQPVIEELLAAGLVGEEWVILFDGCSRNMRLFMAIIRMDQARETLETLPDYWAMVRMGS